MRENKKDRFESDQGRCWRNQRASPKRKKPRLAAGPSDDAQFGFALATALTLLIGFLALPIRILLLLSGLLAAALLLTGLLAWVLVLLAWVLLARILVLVGHRDLPC
jgi:hypothetical protein